MYEREVGSKRLVTAMLQALDDEYVLNRLAQHLNYRPRQLKEDIQAVYDVVYSDRAEKEKSNEKRSNKHQYGN